MGLSLSLSVGRRGLGRDPFINVYGFSGGGGGVIAIPAAAAKLSRSHRQTERQGISQILARCFPLILHCLLLLLLLLLLPLFGESA